MNGLLATAASRIIQGRVWLGKVIAPVRSKDVMSRRKLQEIVSCINPFLQLKVVRGSKDTVHLSDAQCIIELATTQTAPSGTGTGNMTYRGLYSAPVDYSVDDFVYTSPDGNTRIPWVCEIANGPSSTVQAPTWPEAGTVYWRCVAKFQGSGGGIYLAQISALGGVANYDYITVTDPIGGGSLSVAKQQLWRPSITSVTWFGNTYALTYTDDNNRTSAIGGQSQTEQLTPPLQVSDYVYISQVINSTGIVDAGSNPVTWVDVTGREWARVYGQ